MVKTRKEIIASYLRNIARFTLLIIGSIVIVFALLSINKLSYLWKSKHDGPVDCLEVWRLLLEVLSAVIGPVDVADEVGFENEGGIDWFEMDHIISVELIR